MRHFLTLYTILLLLLISTVPVHAQANSITFSSPARQAISALAKGALTTGVNPRITAVKTRLDPHDYATVKTIGVLPDSPWYVFKSLGRTIGFFFTFDQVGKTHRQLKAGNQKTLEALLLIEKAAKENSPKKHDRLIALADSNLDSVGSDFDQVRQTLEKLNTANSPDAAIIQDEAFRFAGQYLKHQVLLQEQEDRLNNADFLTIESTRVKHLGSLADIVVAGNRKPEVLSEQLAQTLSSQVGSNYSRLSLLAILRDLENDAGPAARVPLQTAQSLLQKEFEAKLTKLEKTQRIKLIKRYSGFIHGSPVRQFQAYNLIAKSFTSREMKLLTAGFKDKAAQNFKSHLTALANGTDQRRFIQTLFGSDPVDLRLLAYTEIQLQKPKVLGVTTLMAQTRPLSAQTTGQLPVQLEHLRQLKTILGNKLCQAYGQNPKTLKQTRFFAQAAATPDILDLRVAQFLTQALKTCDSRTPEALATVMALTTQVEQTYINQARQAPVTKLLTRLEAKEILQEEQIVTSSQDEQKVAEQAAEEVRRIEEETANNPDEKNTVELIIQSNEPTREEIVQKEEQIIEEIVDSAKSGETNPLVEELPAETQKEITRQTTPVASPTPAISITVASPTPVVTVVPTAGATLEPSSTGTVIEQAVETVAPTAEPIISPTPAAPKPTLKPATMPAL
ncbi:hypothetical protein HY214_00895 [Candidatus Roizmanbacteria bacterium]|nr:hypothetical protein [Candidatus Roizmanbacteria bacterium]